MSELPRGTSKLILKLSGPAQLKSAALRVMVERPATAKYRQTIELDMSKARAVPGGLEFPVEISLNERGTFEIFSEVRVNDEADVYVRRKVLVK